MNDEDLEHSIFTLIARKNAATEGSAERRMLERQIRGMRYTYSKAGGIIEDLDPEWGYSVRVTRRRL